LPASSKMAGSASRTMQPSVLFEDLRWGESRGSSIRAVVRHLFA
jgi:hypothetical protein